VEIGDEIDLIFYIRV